MDFFNLKIIYILLFVEPQFKNRRARNLRCKRNSYVEREGYSWQKKGCFENKRELKKKRQMMQSKNKECGRTDLLTSRNRLHHFTLHFQNYSISKLITILIYAIKL